MRWVILKDVQILRRSPLLVGLLVIYPIAVALLIGFSLSAGPEKPKVAFANLVPPEGGSFSIGAERFDATQYADELFESIDPIRVRTREEAIQKVRDGEALGALVVPADVVERLRDTINLTGGDRPTLEVYYNAEDPLKRRFVESTIESRLLEANRQISRRLTAVAADYLEILLKGGDFALFGRTIEVLGLQRTAAVLRAVVASLPRDAPERVALDQVIRFAQLAIDNLDLSDAVLASVNEPVQVKQTVLEGARTPLDSFAVAIAVSVSLMFVTLLLAAGLLALEREENAFARLVRGLVSQTGLLVAKVVLAALCALVVAAIMLGGLAGFTGLDFARAPLWVAALAFAALAFGAMGVAIGGLAREVRAASLLTLLLSLPIAFLALVPAGSVDDTLFDVITVVSSIFPFKPTLDALDVAINGGESMLRPLVHLAVLTVAFLAIARVGLGRFARAT